MKSYDVISTRANRIDTPDKATGKAVFVDDITLPGMLYGTLLQSPHAHAKILSHRHLGSGKTARCQGGDHGKGGRPGQVRGQSGPV